MALGKLGWSEYEFYTCSVEGFYYACKGYYAKLEDQSISVRNSTAILFAALGGKDNIDRYWPLQGEEKVKENFVVDSDMMEKIKRVHKLKM